MGLIKFMTKQRAFARDLAPDLYRALSRVSGAVACLYLLGFRVQCPLCGWRFRRLFPGGLDSPIFREHHVTGAGPRLNCVCPHCGCTDRERLVYLYLRDEMKFFRKRCNLLHVAPERNLQRVFLQHRDLYYFSADISSPFAMMRMDLTQVPHEANTFDFVICNHVLEHILKDRQAMSEIYRVLRPGGLAILQVPISYSRDKTVEDPRCTSPQERFLRFGQRDHVRLYGRDYSTRLAQQGFQVDEWDPMMKWGIDMVRGFGLNQNEKLYVCTKPTA